MSVRRSLANVSVRFALAALLSCVAAAAIPAVSFAETPPSGPPKQNADEAAPPMPAPYGSPFGPGYDPTRPPPEEPQTSGPGIAAITVTAHGPAEIEEVRAPD